MSDNKPTGDQAHLSQKALLAKRANTKEPHHPQSGDHADDGPASLPRTDQAPSGALDAEGQRPVLERSKKVR